MSDAMTPEVLPVRRTVRETADTVTLHVDASSRPGGWAFEPGQFDMLYAFGVGEVPISISGDPDRPEDLVHTVRAVGGVTDVLVKLRKGDALGVRGPYGNGWPVEAARGQDVVFVGGGIGFVPLRPAISRVLARRDEYGKVVILYGARTPQDLLFLPDLGRWRSRFDVDVEVIVDRGDPQWRGPVGVVPSLVPRADFDPLDTVAMLCGPEVMLRYTVRALEERGVAPGHIHVSLERSMKCAVGTCGHCMIGPEFVCRDGPVLPVERIAPLLGVRGL